MKLEKVAGLIQDVVSPYGGDNRVPRRLGEYNVSWFYLCLLNNINLSMKIQISLEFYMQRIQ